MTGLKYFLDEKLGNVGLMILYELPILGVAKCTWTCMEMLHLLRMPNMLLWWVLVLLTDPQPEPESTLWSQLTWRVLSCTLIL